MEGPTPRSTTPQSCRKGEGTRTFICQHQPPSEDPDFEWKWVVQQTYYTWLWVGEVECTWSPWLGTGRAEHLFSMESGEVGSVNGAM